MTIGSGETLRILLVAEDEAVRDQVDAALDVRGTEQRLYWVSQPELAVARARDVLPQLILVDDGLGEHGLTNTIRQLVAQSPGAAVMALLDADAMGRARQAVLAGARGFSTKPLHPDDFWTTLRQVLSQQSQPAAGQATGGSTGRIIAFIGPKGGTGRTMIAVNSSIALHKLTGQPVVMVDADFSAPALDVVLNLHDDRDITDLLRNLGKLDDDLVLRVLSTHGSGVRVLLSPPPGSLTEPITVPQMERILAHLKHKFPWVVVDQGLPLDDAANAVLDAAGRIVMTVLPEMVGLRNTRLTLDQLHGRGYPDERVWLVLNRCTMNGGVSRKDIEKRLRVRVRHTIPDDQPLVSHSVNRGVPLITSHPRSAVGRAIQEFAGLLAQESVGAALPASQPQAARSPLQRMFQRTRPAGT